MDNKLKNLEILGIFFTFLSGILLKFCYTLSNMSVWSIFIGAVNSSIWEYTKIFLIPYVIWGILELAMFKKVSLKAFVISKVIGLYSIALLNIIIISILRSILSNNISYIEIIIFFISSIAGFTLSYLSYRNVKESLFSVFFFLMLLSISMIISFTVNPPMINLFKDPLSSTYGLLS